MDRIIQCIVYFANSISQGNGEHTKIGRTEILSNRRQSLNTGYSVEGIDFEYLIHCDSEKQSIEIERYLHLVFFEYSTTLCESHSGGLEWFSKRFTKNEIQHALIKGGYNNIIIDDPIEIEKALEHYRKVYASQKKEYIETMKKERKRIQPNMRDYQNTDNIMNWFDNYNKGILNWGCGLGKCRSGINISKKYVKDYLLIGINNISLISQWIKELKNFYCLPILCICCSNIEETFTTTSSTEIKEWLNNQSKGIIITTYRSSHKLKEYNKIFDFAILDECHHLCNVKEYSNEGDDPEEICNGSIHCRNTDILSLNLNKQLGLTATMKKLDSENNLQLIDNFDEMAFGKVIDEKSILWGIDNNYICDYSLSLPKVNIEDIEEMIQNNGTRGVSRDDYYLYLSAYISINSILKYERNKILIFVNRIEHIEKVYQFIMLLLPQMGDNIPKENILKVDKNTKNTQDMINHFDQNNNCIMINVFKIGEGVDIPSLDAVLFADDMQSTIRIVQSSLRCCRKDPNNPDKKAHIIIPMIYEEDENFNKKDNEVTIKTFPLIRKVIEEISHSDKNILSKIKVNEINIVSKNISPKPKRINESIPELEDEIKMRIIKRCHIGKRLRFVFMRDRIKTLGGRKYGHQSYMNDYKMDKQFKMGLPEYDWLKDFMERNEYNWLDMYSVDINQYMKWEEFEKKHYKKTLEENYNDIPLLHDLQDVYPKYDKRFWDDSGMGGDEF